MNNIIETNRFHRKIEKLRDSLEGYALKLTKNREEAEDLLQETLLKALANKDKFKEGTNLNGWVYTIMRNTFISKTKKLSNRSTFVDTTEGYYFLNARKTSQNEGNSTLVLEDIDEAMGKLRTSYRMPFKLFVKGYKYHEIAERLHIPMGTVKNHIHIARKHLKRELKSYQYDRSMAV